MEEAAEAAGEPGAPGAPDAVKADAVKVEDGGTEEYRVCESSALLRAVATARATADATAETSNRGSLCSV